jgi:predicted nucleic acid-binding protein
MGLTARNAQEHIALGALLARLPQVRITGEDYDRAWEVQGLLAAVGNHRGVAPPDLLVAACAERLGLTVIHCDADFDLNAEVTGHPTRWAVDRDSL